MKRRRCCICIRSTPRRAGSRAGDRVRVFNDRGSLLLKASVKCGDGKPGAARSDPRPVDTVGKRAADGRNANVLTSDALRIWAADRRSTTAWLRWSDAATSSPW